MSHAVRSAVAVALGLALATAAAQAPDVRGLFDPPRAAARADPAAPWTDGAGADHVRRDAERRAAEAAIVPRAAGASTPGTAPVPGPLDPAEAHAWRHQGERERAAREGRVGPLPPPPGVPRIQPDAPPSLAMPPPPRIAIPRAGEPGGPPIALPSCGPAGCVDADGRPMPSAGGGMLIGPGGRPCTRLGSAAIC